MGMGIKLQHFLGTDWNLSAQRIENYQVLKDHKIFPDLTNNFDDFRLFLIRLSSCTAAVCQD